MKETKIKIKRVYNMEILIKKDEREIIIVVSDYDVDGKAFLSYSDFAIMMIAVLKVIIGESVTNKTFKEIIDELLSIDREYEVEEINNEQR